MLWKGCVPIPRHTLNTKAIITLFFYCCSINASNFTSGTASINDCFGRLATISMRHTVCLYA